MRWSTADKVNAGFVAALGVVTIIGVASITSIQRFAATTRDVSVTHRTLTELQSVLSDLAHAESAQRGYLITGNESYLASIEALTGSSIRQIHTLRETTSADDDQQYRLGLLGGLVADRIRLLHEVTAVRRAEGIDAAANLVREGGGRAIMDSIRVLARDFEQTELDRLAARSRSATINGRIAAAIIAAGGIFAFLVVLASGALIRRDYTERRRAEFALRESETLLSQFMENLPIGVIVVDSTWRPRFANNAAVDILGPGILIDDGSHPLPLYHASDHRVYATDQTPLAHALSGQTSTVDDAEVHVGDRQIPIQLSAAPIYDASGRIAYAIAAFSDITERRRGELALRAAKEAAETASRTKSDFLARMSHELRTPLNSVIGFANILLKNRTGNLREQDITYLDRIRDNGRHLLLLINDILDLSKIEAGRLEVELELIDPAALVKEVAQQFEVQVRDRPLELRMNVPTTVAPIHSDPARMRQVLMNLVGNAVKFTERGSVTVAIDTEPQTARPLRIRVRDTGIGIPPDRLDAIFDAFEQAESSTARKYGGTGLGLPISRALCELMGYALTVQSTPGQGAEFTIDLNPPLPAPASPERAAAVGESSERVVLIVDDESDSRVLLSHYIEEFGCRAVTAHSGDEALRLARELKPDLITLDLMMPGQNGWDVLRTLKQDPATAEIPVIVVSIIAHESRTSLLGAIDIVQKPLERELLFAALRRNLNPGGARVLIVDDSRDARTMLEETLAGAAAEVRSAGDGREALRVLQDFEPDIVLLDLLMPVMDGLTFLELFRSTPRFQHVPVVVVTARDLSAEERERIERHTSSILQKGNALESDLRRVLGSLLATAPRNHGRPA